MFYIRLILIQPNVFCHPRKSVLGSISVLRSSNMHKVLRGMLLICFLIMVVPLQKNVTVNHESPYVYMYYTILPVSIGDLGWIIRGATVSYRMRNAVSEEHVSLSTLCIQNYIEVCQLSNYLQFWPPSLPAHSHLRFSKLKLGILLVFIHIFRFVVIWWASWAVVTCLLLLPH